MTFSKQTASKPVKTKGNHTKITPKLIGLVSFPSAPSVCVQSTQVDFWDTCWILTWRNKWVLESSLLVLLNTSVSKRENQAQWQSWGRPCRESWPQTRPRRQHLYLDAIGLRSGSNPKTGCKLLLSAPSACPRSLASTIFGRSALPGIQITPQRENAEIESYRRKCAAKTMQQKM